MAADPADAILADLEESAHALILASKNHDDEGFVLLWRELGERQLSVAFTMAKMISRHFEVEH